MVRRLDLGKNNHLTYASLALNPQFVIKLETSPFFLHAEVSISVNQKPCEEGLVFASFSTLFKAYLDDRRVI